MGNLEWLEDSTSKCRRQARSIEEMRYLHCFLIYVPTAGLIFCNYNLTSNLYKINYGNILKLKCQLSGFIRDFKFIFSKL